MILTVTKDRGASLLYELLNVLKHPRRLKRDSLKANNTHANMVPSNFKHTVGRYSTLEESQVIKCVCLWNDMYPRQGCLHFLFC